MIASHRLLDAIRAERRRRAAEDRFARSSPASTEERQGPNWDRLGAILAKAPLSRQERQLFEALARGGRNVEDILHLSELAVPERAPTKKRARDQLIKSLSRKVKGVR